MATLKAQINQSAISAEMTAARPTNNESAKETTINCHS